MVPSQRPPQFARTVRATTNPPDVFTSDEQLVLKDLIRQHRYRKYKIDKDIRVTMGFDFAIHLGQILSQCYRGDDKAIQKFAADLLRLEGGEGIPPDTEY